MVNDGCEKEGGDVVVVVFMFRTNNVFIGFGLIRINCQMGKLICTTIVGILN